MKHTRAIKAAALLAAILLGLGAIYLLRPPCLILQTTGYACAGCGTQRMVTALLQGDVAEAFGHNPFMFILLPLAGLYALWEALRYVQGKPPLARTKGGRIAWITVLLAAAVFTVLRNVPGVTVLGP